MERLKVLYYDSFTTHDSIGVKRKLRFRSFNGYLKEEEWNVRPAEHNEILGVDYTRDIDYDWHTIRVFFRDDNENKARAKNAAYRRSKVSDATFQFLLFYLSKYRELLQHQQMLFANIEEESRGKALQVDAVYRMLERMEKKQVSIPRPICCGDTSGIWDGMPGGRWKWSVRHMGINTSIQRSNIWTRICEKLSHKISIQSEEGKGTAVTVDMRMMNQKFW